MTGYYKSVHNCIDIENQIPPSLPCLPAGRLYKREEFPSLEKRGEGRFSKEYVFSIMDSLVIL